MDRWGMSRSRRAIAAIALSIPMFLVSLPAPVAAKDPGIPLPGHTPAFVTEREVGTWEDCLWASSSMLLDKWSAGRLTVDPDRLRALSGDFRGGSNFDNLRASARRLGFTLRTSPDGGDFITWGKLLKRLRSGGGAVLLGDYHDLPRWYGRWDPGFWKKTGKKDNHALYLDHANRRGTKVWVMDPLAPAGWQGEWIPVWALRNYAWQTPQGGLWAAMTPKAKPAPFAGVELGPVVAEGVGSKLRLEWPIESMPKGWRLPKTRIRSTFEKIDVPVVPPADSVMVALPKGKPAAARTAVRGKRLIVNVSVPTKPGVYRLDLGIRERRFGKTVARAPLTVYVAGERRASVSVVLKQTVTEPRTTVDARILVINTGFVPWADAPERAGETERRETRLELRWVEASDPEHVIVVDRDVPLVLPSRKSEVLDLELTAPGPGDWLLVAGVSDAIDGPFARTGSREGVAPLTVSPPERAIH